MTGRGFANRWIICIVGLVVVGLLFPFFLPPLVKLTGCKGVSGACGAVALVFGIFFRLPLVIGAGIYLAVLVWKRSKAIQLLPQGMSFFVITYLAASPILFGFGNFWASRFALGFGLGSGGNVALPAIGCLLAGLGGLSLISNNDSREDRYRISTFLLGAAIAGLLVPGASSGLRTVLPFAWRIIMPVEFALRRLYDPIFEISGRYILIVLLIAFCLSVAFWARSERRSPA